MESRASLGALAVLVAVGCAAPSIEGPHSPPPPPQRPDGVVYGVDVGLGLASSRTAPAPQTTPSFAALGSLLIGIWPGDSLLVAGRFDASLMNGVGVADLAVHLGLFPGAASSGPLRNFSLFVDGGVGVPIAGGSGLASAPPLAPMARIGVGWQRWRVGPALVGPLLCGQIVRSTGEADAALLGGITASLDAPAPRK